tara:strand:- start:7931 stop:10342 length:2412 start_codon:yes stop_codon:yes gene_type:complete
LANLFNGGYSKQSTLEGNLIQGEDRSDRILEEGKRYLNQWKEVSEGERVNQERYLTALQKSFDEETANRTSNEKIASVFRKGWGEALTKRHNQLLKNSEAKAAENVKFNEDLAKAFKIGGDIVGKKAQQMSDKQVEFGRSLTVDIGLPSEMLEALQVEEDLGYEANKQNNNAIYQARKRGYTEDQINQLRNLNWWQKRGVAIGHAQHLGENYKNLILSNNETEYASKYGGSKGTVSLGQAFAQSNVGGTRLALSKIKEEFLKSIEGVSEAHLGKYVRPGIVAAEAQVIEAVEKKAAKEANEAYNERKRATVVAALKEGPDKLWKLWESESGENGEFRSASWNNVTNYMIEAIKNGSLNRRHIEAWGEQPFDGKKGSKMVMHHHPGRWTKLMDAVSEAERAEAVRNTSQETVRNSQLSKQTEDLRSAIEASEKQPNRSELATMIAEANKMHGPDNKMSKMLMNFSRDHVSDANDKIYTPWLDQLEAQGLLTPSIVEKANLTWVKRAEYIKKANENSPYAASEDQIKLMDDYVEKKIERAINDFGLESKHVPSSAMALYEGKASLKRYFRTYAQKAGANSQEVYNAAIAAWNADFKENYQIVEFQGGTRAPYFKNFAIGSKISPVPLSEITTKELADNPNLLDQKLLVDGVGLKKFFDQATMGRFNGWPSDIMHLQSKIGIGPQGQVMTEADIAIRQLEVLKETGQVPKDYKLPPELMQAYKVGTGIIRPEWKKYICGSRCNKHSTAASLVYSGYETTETKKNGLVAASPNGFSLFRQPQNMEQYITPADADWTEYLINGGGAIV